MAGGTLPGPFPVGLSCATRASPRSAGTVPGTGTGSVPSRRLLPALTFAARSSQAPSEEVADV